MTSSSNFLEPGQRGFTQPAEPDRIGHLEAEIAELRETIAHFAELILGEVKELRQARAAGEPSANAAAATSARTAEPRGRPWLLVELARDLATTVRMYLDPRYRVRRSTQLLVPLIAGLFALNCVFFNALLAQSITGGILEKAGDVILSVLLYRVLSHELVRYRQVIAQWRALPGGERRIGAIVVGGEPATTRLETD